MVSNSKQIYPVPTEKPVTNTTTLLVTAQSLSIKFAVHEGLWASAASAPAKASIEKKGGHR
ncbi:hypothetical protein GCM10027180_16050 [Microbulbifer echini]